MEDAKTLDEQIYRFGFWSVLIVIASGTASGFIPLDVPGGYLLRTRPRALVAGQTDALSRGLGQSNRRHVQPVRGICLQYLADSPHPHSARNTGCNGGFYVGSRLYHSEIHGDLDHTFAE